LQQWCSRYSDYVPFSCKQSWGIKTSFKTMACSNAFNEGINDLIYRSINNEPVSGLNLDLKDGKQTNALSYIDVTLNFSKIVHNNSYSILSLGVSGKALWGLDALSLLTLNSRTIHQGDSSFKVADAQYAYAFPLSNQNSNFLTPRGIGVGSDIGLTYMRRLHRRKHPLKCASIIKRMVPLREYKWKLGIAIIDIGGIFFQNEATQKTLTLLYTQLDTIRFKDIRNANHFDSLIVQNTLPSGQVLNYTSFYAGLPTALTIQLDQFLGDNFFMHYSFNQRLITDDGIRMFKANQLSIMPRYESEDWDASIKAGLVEYELPILGAAIRYKSVRIGAELVTGLFFNSVFGVGIHMGISLHKIQGTGLPKMRF
ncbi:MAG: DUF5723 family protein, partial [Bacteroidota bacterium]